ncbi:MAG: hypothetical protein NTU59_10030 [Coprothermobacterota bacterium]|nr:hypothetical protein [Coprothermobacterota bacterium]
MLLQDDYLRLLTESGFHQITVYGNYRFQLNSLWQHVYWQTADSTVMM